VSRTQEVMRVSVREHVLVCVRKSKRERRKESVNGCVALALFSLLWFLFASGRVRVKGYVCVLYGREREGGGGGGWQKEHDEGVHELAMKVRG